MVKSSMWLSFFQTTQEARRPSFSTLVVMPQKNSICSMILKSFHVTHLTLSLASWRHEDAKCYILITTTFLCSLYLSASHWVHIVFMYYNPHLQNSQAVCLHIKWPSFSSVFKELEMCCVVHHCLEDEVLNWHSCTCIRDNTSVSYTLYIQKDLSSSFGSSTSQHRSRSPVAQRLQQFVVVWPMVIEPKMEFLAWLLVLILTSRAAAGFTVLWEFLNMSITQHVALRTKKVAYRLHWPANDVQMKLGPYTQSYWELTTAVGWKRWLRSYCARQCRIFGQK